MAASSSSMAGSSSGTAAASRAAAPMAAGAGSSSGKGATVNDDVEGIERSEKFFGTSPVRLVDDVFNVTSVYMKRGLDQMETELLEDPYTQKDPLIIQQGIAQAYQRLFSSLEKNIDKFEIYVVRNILKVPRHLDSAVSLDDTSCTTVTEAAEEEMDQELEALRRKIYQAEFVYRSMSAKVQDLQAQIMQVEEVQAVFDQTDQLLSEHSLPPLEATVSEVLFKEPEVKALEKQYIALAGERAKENTAIDLDEQTLEMQFSRCKAKMGGSSTRTMDHLGTLLGAR